MNRRERRLMEKSFRSRGLTKAQAKQAAGENSRTILKKGQKCKLNYELIIRHPEFKKQQEEFKVWVEQHANEILTVDKTRNDGHEVTFIEDNNKNQFWHLVETLTPIASATIKLNDGSEKIVSLDGVQSVEDPLIQERINEALNDSKEGETT